MSNFGFGFPNPGDNDDDRDGDGNRGNGSGRPGGGSGDGSGGQGGQPFGDGNPFSFLFGGTPGAGASGQAGNLGDILNQFGAMLSGFGQDMNSPDAAGPMNYALAERIARQQLSGTSSPSQRDSEAVAESVRLVELWLDESTDLPAGATGSVSFGPVQWLEETLPRWKRLVNPLAEKLGDAALNGLPEEARQQAGPMMGIMNQVNGMNFGMQLGRTLGEIAKDVSTSTQWGMPLAERPVAAVATGRLADLARKLGAERRETLIYLAAREAAHHRLFQHVPWLVERLVLDVEEFAAGLSLDYSAMEEATREFNPEMMNDPEALQEMMGRLQGEDLAPAVVSSNQQARVRMETSLSLVEGWVDVVVGDALGERLPETASIAAAWSAYRDTGQPAMESLAKAVGISLTAPKASEAAELWRRLTVAVGASRRDAVWDHPDFLPVDGDLDNPAEFIDSVLAENDDVERFDPISEIEKLERERTGRGEGDGDGKGESANDGKGEADDSRRDDSGDTSGGDDRDDNP
ncbi:zinc-dependent metalloprotease [Corynebacterium bovis]|uniref:Putative hydrolase n=1 Tax=Corynebacterium bovis DSM 20582 = CIP 54.80 TaxID=927655 RepID=A0A8H9Y904_9CORY|nr:zinc-dependent metalloprotease [Corynebacterium bovis]MBB3115701.1 putative hydrolase [Corynebacterium bovis DSM 20582 = CIP 54.80]QQC47388.1 zinc-dependent metalloprotease [Corynebacterium bovis]RRO79573.1 hydrolase [Corynebacterium bovis]RRO82407.1 hydrolase [Corynebacterium bovis]RRO83054.1 hydrolase [Corynebacterium bovis]